jgi:hypothetical protein
LAGEHPEDCGQTRLKSTDADLDRAATETALWKALLNDAEKQRNRQSTAPWNAKTP